MSGRGLVCEVIDEEEETGKDVNNLVFKEQLRLNQVQNFMAGPLSLH